MPLYPALYTISHDIPYIFIHIVYIGIKVLSLLLDNIYNKNEYIA